MSPAGPSAPWLPEGRASKTYSSVPAVSSPSSGAAKMRSTPPSLSSTVGLRVIEWPAVEKAGNGTSWTIRLSFRSVRASPPSSKGAPAAVLRFVTPEQSWCPPPAYSQSW